MTHDFDQGLASWYRRGSGERIDPPVSIDRTAAWYSVYEWRVEFTEVEQLIQVANAHPVFFAGTVTNEAEIWGRFDLVVFLRADLATLLGRLRVRSSDQFGSSADELARVAVEHVHAEDRYKRWGAQIIDVTQPLELVVDLILGAAGVVP